MQVKFNCNNSNPQFGMAFRKPHGTDMSKLSDFLGLEKDINRKGFAQFLKEMKNNKRFDVDYLADGDVARVIDSNTEDVVDTFHGCKNITGLHHFGATEFLGKEWLAKIFSPKQFLPYNFLEAGKKANQLEEEVIQKQFTRKLIDELT